MSLWERDGEARGDAAGSVLSDHVGARIALMQLLLLGSLQSHLLLSLWENCPALGSRRTIMQYMQAEGAHDRKGGAVTAHKDVHRSDEPG